MQIENPALDFLDSPSYTNNYYFLLLMKVKKFFV